MTEPSKDAIHEREDTRRTKKWIDFIDRGVTTIKEASGCIGGYKVHITLEKVCM